jgi:hypothetical protein
VNPLNVIRVSLALSQAQGETQADALFSSSASYGTSHVQAHHPTLVPQI